MVKIIAALLSMNRGSLTNVVAQSPGPRSPADDVSTGALF
jgi:hypothetical protein